MIRTFFRLPFGHWGFCEFPSTTGNNTLFGKIRNGRDLLVWVGRLELVLGRERRNRNLGMWNWNSFAPHQSVLSRSGIRRAITAD